jgi:NAD(P)-dependent dehydrogenase (short-subunit alcohol dehydrogenase family)
MPDMRRYEGRTVLVTGGGSGIGEACCLRLASEGAKVGVLDVDGAHAERTAAKIQGQGGQAIAVPVDTSNPAAVEAAVARVVETLGPLKLAVNNAGIGGARLPPEEATLEQWDRTIAVNLSGYYYCMRAEHPRLLGAGGGAIVNTASIHSVIAMGTNPAYTAAKHGVLALTRTCALAWGKQGIRVNAVGPGFVDTPLTAPATADYRAQMLAKSALDHFAEAEDIAATVAFLGSDEAKSTTGALYMVDAGYTVA